MTFDKFVDLNLYFIIYAFLGWIVEVVYIFLRTHKLQNRGFLYGPFLPIYGFGAIIIILILTPFKFNPLLVFIFGVLLSTLLEYISAYFLETTFHIKWWDYSSYRYNFQGRICIRNSILFGFLTLIVIFGIQPIVENITNTSIISLENKRLINDVFFVLIIIDLYFTLKKLNKLPFRDIELLNTPFKDIKNNPLNDRLLHLEERFKNSDIPQKFNLLLFISGFIGLTIIFISNIYVALLLTIIIFLILYVVKGKKRKDDK